MRRSLAILLTIMCALCFAGPVNVNAGALVGSGSCGDDAYWQLNSDGEMRIYGSGATYDYSYDSYNSKPWKNYSSQIKKVIIDDGITKVGAYLFNGSPIQSVEFNNTNNLVIGQNAFAESSLTDINFGSGTITVSKNAFSKCNSLEYVDVTENIVMDGNKQSSEEGSGNQLFYSCANLKSATVSCANVGRYMFENCYNLENVTFSNPDTKFYCLEGGFQNGFLSGHPFNSGASGTWEVNIIAPECSQAHRLAEVGNINSTSLSYTQIEGDETSHSGGTATCTDEAICTKCGMPYGTSLGHVYGDLIEKQPATCTEDGMEAHYCCSACNWFFDSNKQRTTEEALTIKAAHEWNDDYTVDKAPSCTEKGSQSIHCKNCDATKDSEEIKETGHSWEDIAIHPATPNESGYTAYKRCSVCEDTSGGEAIAQIDAQTLTLSEDEYTYDGEAKTPSVSVKDMDGIALTAGTDYTVSYKDNKAAGIATAVVEFKDNYDGTLEKQFTILSRGTTDLVFELDETEVEFDGTAKTPGIVIREENGTLLVKDEDYTVSYQNNTNPGTGKIIITFSDNYGGAEAVREFEIVCKHSTEEHITPATFEADGNIDNVCSKCKETISSTVIPAPIPVIGETELLYNGEKQTPEVSIAGLEEGKDYIIEWPEESTKPGNYTGTIKLTGDRYSGEKTVEFSISELRSIVPKDTTIKVRVGKTRQIELDEVYGDVTYKTANKKIVTVSSTGKLKGIKKGTTTVTVTATGDESHNPATVDITVIVPTVITKVALKSTSASYDGNVHMPVVKSVNGSTTTAKKEGIYRTYITDADGNEVTEPVDAGKYYLVVEAIGTYDGTVKKAYTINPAAQTINIESGTKATIYKGKADYELNASSEQGGEISYKVTSGTSYASLADGHFVHAKKAGKATVTVTAASVGNYKATTKKITITVKNPAKLSTSNITVLNCAYTGSPVEPEVTVKNANAGEYTVSYSSNEAIGTATVTVTPKAECQPYTETAVNKTFKILPEGTSITLEAAAKSFTATWEVPATAEKSEMTGYKIRYSTSSKMSKPKTITIKDPAAAEKTVASLPKAKTYYVQICTYKTIGKTTYASPWSETVKVKTL